MRLYISKYIAISLQKSAYFDIELHIDVLAELHIQKKCSPCQLGDQLNILFWKACRIAF